MAIHLRTKTDLINLAEANLSEECKSIARAFHTGTVENLGAFQEIPPHYRPGWILKLTSQFKNIFYVAVVAGKLTCRAYMLDEPLWEDWEGDRSDNKMYQGDNPLLYKELRNVKSKSDETII